MNDTIIDRDFVAEQNQFRRSPKLASILRVFYIILIAATAIDSMIQLWAYFVVEKGIMILHESDYARLETAGIFQTIINLISLLLSITATVLFLVWVNRCYQNLEPLGKRPSFGKWLFGLSWFIPFVALVLPIFGIREIWNGYQKENGDNPRLWQGLEFVYLWWVLYVLYRLFWWGFTILPAAYSLLLGEGALFTNLDLNKAILLGISIQIFLFIPVLVLQMHLVQRVNQWEIAIHAKREPLLTATSD
jgi:hypothetical protein